MSKASSNSSSVLRSPAGLSKLCPVSVVVFNTRGFIVPMTESNSFDTTELPETLFWEEKTQDDEEAGWSQVNLLGNECLLVAPEMAATIRPSVIADTH